jgi:hypothetical protein
MARIRPHCRARLRAAATTTAVASALVLSAAPSEAAVPYLQIAPPMAREGAKLTVYGRGFCPRAACSRIVLAIDGRWVARAFRPRANGRFVKTIVIRQQKGPHVLAATQTRPSHRRLRASLRLIVLPSGGD